MIDSLNRKDMFQTIDLDPSGILHKYDIYQDAFKIFSLTSYTDKFYLLSKLVERVASHYYYHIEEPIIVPHILADEIKKPLLPELKDIREGVILIAKYMLPKVDETLELHHSILIEKLIDIQNENEVLHNLIKGITTSKQEPLWVKEYFQIPSYEMIIGTPAEKKFRQLSEQWKNERKVTSTVLEMALHPAYQQIIGMGPISVPLILVELDRELDQWFWALEAITCVDPVPESDRGRIRKMAEAWISWGRENGYIR